MTIFTSTGTQDMHFPDCGAENLWTLKEKGKASSNMTLVLVSVGNIVYFHTFALNVRSISLK